MHSLFQQANIDLMIEFGSFMGGSALEWLSANENMNLICVDPWPDSLATYVNNLQSTGWALQLFGLERLRDYTAILERHGALKVVQNNLWDCRGRLALVQAHAPAIYPILAPLQPDLIFIDMLKKREEFIESHVSFPDAIIAGDDWTWADATGRLPVQDFVVEVAALRGGVIYADLQTFVIAEPRHSLVFDEKYLYRR